MRIPAIPCLWLLLASLRAQGDQLAAARAALAAAEQQHGAASVAALQARLQVASQLFKAGQLQPARAELRPAIALAQALGDARIESAGRLMLAAVLTDLQDLPAARAEAEAGLLLRRRELPAGHAAIAEACNSLASVLAAIGDLAGARPLFDEARAGFAKAPGQGMRAAMVSNNLAAVAARELDYPAAIEHATAAVAMATQARGENDHTTLQLRSNLGRALISVGRLDSARALLERVLAAQQQQLGERHLRTFETELALLGLRMTTLPEASAIADAERLQATAVELFGARHATTRGVEWLLIEAQRRAGQLQAALAGVEGQRAQGSAGETIER